MAGPKCDIFEYIRDTVHIYDKMTETNKNLRYLFKDYEEKVVPVKECIRKVMAAQKKDVLPATIDLMTAAMEKDNAVHAMWFMSAAVDVCNEKQVV